MKVVLKEKHKRILICPILTVFGFLKFIWFFMQLLISFQKSTQNSIFTISTVSELVVNE